MIFIMVVISGCGSGNSYHYEQQEVKNSKSKIYGMAKDTNGFIYTVDRDNNIQKYNSTGALENEFKLDIPDELKMTIKGMGIDSENKIYADIYEIGPDTGNGKKIHSIWKFDENGKKEGEVSVKENDTIGYSQAGFNSIYLTDDKGYMYVNDNTLLIETDSNGKQKDTIIQNKVFDYVKVDNFIYAIVEEDGTTFLVKKDLGKSDYEFRVKVDDSAYYAKLDYDKNNKEILYVSSRLELEVYDEQGNKTKELGKGVDFPLFLQNIEILKMLINENGDILINCRIDGQKDATFAMVTLAKKEGEKEASNKKVVNVGANNEDEMLSLKALATEFMKENPEVIIQVNNYNYTKATASDYLKKINTEMMSGEGDDLLPTEHLPMNKFMKNGILEELNEYMDKDSSIKKEQYYKNILDSFKYDNKYYAWPYAFKISGLIVDEDLVQQKSLNINDSNFNRKDFVKVMQDIKANSNTSSLAKLDKTDLMKILFYPQMQNWINYKNNTTNFNDASFDNFIDDIETIVVEDLISKEMSFMDAKLNLREDELVFELLSDITPLGFNGVADIYNYKDNFSIYAVPGLENSSKYAFGAYGFGLSSTSKNKEEAWKFMKYVSENYGLDGSSDAFNPNIKINEDMIDKATKAEKRPTVYLTADVILYNYPIDEKTGEQLKEIMKKAEINTTLDPQIEAIISDSFEKYTKGELNKEELKNNLDSKIQTYLKE